MSDSSQLVTVEYRFRVRLKIKNADAAEARRLVKEQFGLVGPEVSCTIEDDRVHWEADVHPSDEEIISVEDCS